MGFALQQIKEDAENLPVLVAMAMREADDYYPAGLPAWLGEIVAAKQAAMDAAEKRAAYKRLRDFLGDTWRPALNYRTGKATSLPNRRDALERELEDNADALQLGAPFSGMPTGEAVALFRELRKPVEAAEAIMLRGLGYDPETGEFLNPADAVDWATALAAAEKARDRAERRAKASHVCTPPGADGEHG